VAAIRVARKVTAESTQTVEPGNQVISGVNPLGFALRKTAQG
jgi:hypothetical protein